MSYSSGHWYVVLSARELKSRPLARTRFGQRLVFWRDSDGKPACLLDRCPHRGAALSLGDCTGDNIACPYHGFQFDGLGYCQRVPAEGRDFKIPAHFRASAFTVGESQDYIWLWTGPELGDEPLPPPPRQPGIDALISEECQQVWPADHTRCMEGVLDHSHLPFVHRRTLGRRIKDPTTRIRVEQTPCGLRAKLMENDRVRHHVDLTYPNIWTQLLTDGYAMSTAFAPIDERRTQVYCRVHYAPRWRAFRPLMRLWCRFSNYLVFHEDQAVLQSQFPYSVDHADAEKLVPSDAAIVGYRQLRRQHLDALTSEPAAKPPTSS